LNVLSRRDMVICEMNGDEMRWDGILIRIYDGMKQADGIGRMELGRMRGVISQFGSTEGKGDLVLWKY
jgi:hypothetical protein